MSDADFICSGCDLSTCLCLADLLEEPELEYELRRSCFMSNFAFDYEESKKTEMCPER